jgi:hypothetical protein
MNPRPTSLTYCPLLPMLLVGLTSQGVRDISTVPVPTDVRPASSSVIGAAVPWQVAPALLAPGLMPEAYYSNTTTSSLTLPAGSTQGSTSTGNGGDPGGSGDPGGPGDPSGGDPKDPGGAPEPATLVSALIGIGLVGFGTWRRRTKRLVQQTG